MPTVAPASAPETAIDSRHLPRHIAVICDGNGRWARERGMPRLLGHHQGYLAVREIVRAASDLGIQYLTLYAFSTENWSRPKAETDGLMRLFIEGARHELRELHANNVRMHFSGRLCDLPDALQAELQRHRDVTAQNTGLTLNICLSYGGREEILAAARRLVERAARGEIGPQDVTEESFSEGLYTVGLPDPDLLIRTAGDLRVSNYLLWQIAYTEIHVTSVRWPDFRKEHLVAAIADYQSRERRFGGVRSAA
jgi:undecaprenyl diphosphate synthase